MKGPIFTHLIFMAFGYLFAVFFASIVTVFVLLTPAIFPSGGTQTSNGSIKDILFPMLFFGTYYTGIYAAPGWLVSVIVAELRIEQRKYWFGVAGILTAALALFIENRFSGELRFSILLLSAALIGGFVGGLVYWTFAGKHSGVRDW